MIELFYIPFFIWIVFFGGAERLENSVLGYFEFGLAAQNVIYVKILAWPGLAITLFIFARGLGRA